MKEGQKEGSLIFAVNGEKFELSRIDPSTTLLQFLRSETRFKSPKLGCGEGIVVVSMMRLAVDGYMRGRGRLKKY